MLVCIEQKNKMEPNWFALDEAFTWKLVSMFEWPFGSRNYGLGCPFSMDDAVKCIRRNLDEYINWIWDGERIMLQGEQCCGKPTKPEFYGPIHSQALDRILKMEEELTKIYQTLIIPSFNYLIEKVIDAKNAFAQRGIPVERITLPHPWKNLLTGDVLFGHVVTPGKARVLSPSSYGAFQDIHL